MKTEKKMEKRILRFVLQVLIGCAAAGGFVLLNVSGGPLVLMDYIGGWTMRGVYLVLCGLVIFAAFALLALQKRDWMTYAVTATALFLNLLYPRITDILPTPQALLQIKTARFTLSK